MNKSKIALKPYLDKIAGFCDTLSNEALTDIIISFAKDVPTSVRVEFLKKIESCLPDRKMAAKPEVNSVEQILDDIQALKESIEERISSIEDGGYQDDPDDWEDDEYYDDDPEYVSKDQIQELEFFFNDAATLFLNNSFQDARKVYQTLFGLINYIKENTYSLPDLETDIRENRARYCRCVYETSDADKRLDEFALAMAIEEFDSYNENEYDEDYPLLQDVIDACQGKMKDIESFLPAWKKYLSKKGTKARPAILLLETVNRLGGISEVSGLAEKWKNIQPQGYLFWLKLLKAENDAKGIIKAGLQGLKALEKSRYRERVAEFLIDAAEKLNDAEQILNGKRERFFSHTSDQNLLDLVDEAIKQNTRDKEIDTIINFFKDRKIIDQEKKQYTKVLLMSGRLNDAIAMAKKEKSLGWSSLSCAGVVFGSVVSVIAGHTEKASIIKILLKGYANEISIYSQRFSIDNGLGTSFYDEIIKGLKQEKEPKPRMAEYLSWAEKIGKKRIENIVSNKHRGAYEKAAQVLGSIAEAYVATGQKSIAEKILHKYYSEKYNRFSAFRREVQAVVMVSELLRDICFIK